MNAAEKVPLSLTSFLSEVRQQQLMLRFEMIKKGCESVEMYFGILCSTLCVCKLVCFCDAVLLLWIKVCCQPRSWLTGASDRPQRSFIQVMSALWCPLTSPSLLTLISRSLLCLWSRLGRTGAAAGRNFKTDHLDLCVQKWQIYAFLASFVHLKLVGKHITDIESIHPCVNSSLITSTSWKVQLNTEFFWL